MHTSGLPIQAHVARPQHQITYCVSIYFSIYEFSFFFLFLQFREEKKNVTALHSSHRPYMGHASRAKKAKLK